MSAHCLPIATALSIYQRACMADRALLRETGKELTEKWTELEWQTLWYSGAFGTLFRSTRGAAIEIVQLGFWNREPGPDFVHASIRVDGQSIQSGDIEFDMHVADWESHGHSQNSDFDQVILHLFLHRSGAERFTRTSRNREVIQVHLQKEVELFNAPSGKVALGRCAKPLQELDPSTTDVLIEAAAQIRITRKADQFRRAVSVHGMDEALFQAFAVALGYKLNKLPFLLLAQRARLRFLRDQGLAAEAILFGLAGFLGKQIPGSEPNREYLAQLWQHWWRRHQELNELVISPKQWRFGMTRPNNHPHRRLGALAELVRRWKELRLLKPSLVDVGDWLKGISHPFWDYHFSLNSNRTEKSVVLIGQTRINEILANVIFPMLTLNHKNDWETFKQIPAELGNRNLALVCQRLFGSTEREQQHTKYLYQQQGLLQIFEDFCLSDLTNCENCKFPSMAQELKKTLR
ncbi:MAG: DUF2851 family protein [Verrucomicrobia bacterium]|nr:DUF2851 family protein [Verrucomicrobiota bacterium]